MIGPPCYCPVTFFQHNVKALSHRSLASAWFGLGLREVVLRFPGRPPGGPGFF